VTLKWLEIVCTMTWVSPCTKRARLTRRPGESG
jgi:hypothetical protein